MSRKKTAKPQTEKPLTLKQETFGEALFITKGNGVAAARMAGYAGDVSTLNSVARHNLQNPAIQAYRRRRLAGLKAQTDEILYLLGDHLRADIGDFSDCFNPDGSIDIEKAKSKDLSRLIKEIDSTVTFDEDGNRVVKTKLKLHDSQAAAKLLADIHGLKQMPRENDMDGDKLALVQAKARQCFEYLLTRCESEEDALAVMADRYPNLRMHLELDPVL